MEDNQASGQSSELVVALVWVGLMAVLVVALEDYRAWTVAVAVAPKDLLPLVMKP
jgi:hypothetical protein